jgi:hypothetical protein
MTPFFVEGAGTGRPASQLCCGSDAICGAGPDERVHTRPSVSANATVSIAKRLRDERVDTDTKLSTSNADGRGFVAPNGAGWGGAQ